MRVSPAGLLLACALTLGVGGLGGYWLSTAKPWAKPASVNPAKPERKILYYRNPMGLPDTSPVPKKDPMGMDYVPVYEDESTKSAQPSKTERKVLYYRNPMGQADTSPVPKKDPMGMDYIPVYEDELNATAMVRISAEKVQQLGVRTEAATVRELTQTVRAVGVVAADERRLFSVVPRFEGYIQKLLVNTTGETVRRGQPLMEVYSPELVSAQQEYLIAWKGMQSIKDGAPELQASMRELADSALTRLRNWDISQVEIERLQNHGEAHQTMYLRAQADGVVIEKPSLAGQRFMPGEPLYRIADLSQVWLLADVFEQDLGLVRPGLKARISVDAYPDRQFSGQVTFVYPTIAPQTRTAKVRIELANPNGLLKPDMYGRVELDTRYGKGPVLTVPDSAVLDSGTRQIVLVQRGQGLFEPRPVKAGMRAEGLVEIREGIEEGDTVVVSANFLIDAESNLKAAIGGFGGHAHGASGAATGKAAPVEKPAAAEAAAPPASSGEPTGSAAPSHSGHQ